jgi:hypothetical protein
VSRSLPVDIAGRPQMSPRLLLRLPAAFSNWPACCSSARASETACVQTRTAGSRCSEKQSLSIACISYSASQVSASVRLDFMILYIFSFFPLHILDSSASESLRSLMRVLPLLACSLQPIRSFLGSTAPKLRFIRNLSFVSLSSFTREPESGR